MNNSKLKTQNVKSKLKTQKFAILSFGFALLALSFTLSCGSSSSSNGGGASNFSGTVPGDVVVSSPTAAASGTTSLNKSVLKDANSDYETKKEALTTLIAGTGSCTFTAETLGNLTLANCYGPIVKVQGHPDDATKTTFGGGDLGIWNSTNMNDASEACSAAQMNNVVDFAASRVDNFINIMGAIACAGEKGGRTPPAVGSSLDLTTDISSFVSVTGLTITSAAIERLADDGTNPVYKLTIGGTLTVDSKIYTISFILKHVPTAADNSTYKGKISFSYSYTDPTNTRPGNCGADFSAVTSEGSVQAGMILYEKTSATSVTYEMNMAEFCGASTDPFDASNNIDPTDVVSVTNPDGWANSYNYGLFNVNPANGTGTVAYAWAAGYGNESTRALNVTTTEASDGSASGNAYFGYGPSFQSSTSTTRGSITSMMCNWGGTSSGRIAQHQALSRAATGTVFGTTADHTTFAPSNSCDSAGGGTFKYSSDQTLASNPMTNDNYQGNAVTNNLIDLDTEMTFTRPTSPADVGG